MKLKFFLTTVVILSVVASFVACSSDEPRFEDMAYSGQVSSKKLSQEEAFSVASRFASINNNGETIPQSSRSTSDIIDVKGSDDNILAYIINYDGGGWVMVSATTTYHPILAYSDEPNSQFVVADKAMNEGLTQWIKGITMSIENSSNLSEKEVESISYEWIEFTPCLSAASASIPGGNSEQAVKCRNRLKELNDTYYKDGWSFVTLSSLSQGAVPDVVYSTADSYNSPYQHTIVGLRDDKTIDQKGPLLTTQWD